MTKKPKVEVHFGAELRKEIIQKSESQVVKAWASVDEKGRIIFPTSSRLPNPKNGKYQWYKYVIISDKKYGVVKQNGTFKAIRVEIREVSK